MAERDKIIPRGGMDKQAGKMAQPEFRTMLQPTISPSPNSPEDFPSPRNYLDLQDYFNALENFYCGMPVFPNGVSLDKYLQPDFNAFDESQADLRLMVQQANQAAEQLEKKIEEWREDPLKRNTLEFSRMEIYLEGCRRDAQVYSWHIRCIAPFCTKE